MRYYAHFGHKDFILCLGYRADCIKQYFLKYDETVSNDFVMTDGGRKVDLLTSDIQDWKITFVDTGLHSNIGMRLKAVQPFLEGEEMFLANYSDGLSDVLAAQDDRRLPRTRRLASFAGRLPHPELPPRQRRGRRPRELHPPRQGHRDADQRRLLRLPHGIFDWIREGEELVEGPFQRLAAAGSSWPIPTTASGPAWTPSRTSSSSTTSTRRGHVDWEVWKAR
jgi:glucose-1-phosphate cytidylyltransferase